MAGENWTFWLQMTNLAMGVIILLAAVPVFGSVVWEAAQRARNGRNESKNLDSELRALYASVAHTLSDPELGLTMADGGEEVKNPPRK
jgi:high-affinity Fe2+/Pb2+ permease